MSYRILRVRIGVVLKEEAGIVVVVGEYGEMKRRRSVLIVADLIHVFTRELNEVGKALRPLVARRQMKQGEGARLSH